MSRRPNPRARERAELAVNLDEPELSFVMPCYNEQDVIPFTIPAFCDAFARAGVRLELVACDNGSKDRTGEILRALRAKGYPIVVHRVEPNEGYGNGVLKTFPVCRAPWIGVIAMKFLWQRKETPAQDGAPV